MTTTTSAAAIDDLADAYWEDYLEREPVGATAIGDRRYDDRLPDRSPEAVAAHRRFLAELRDRVTAVDASALDADQAATHAALVAQIAAHDAELGTDLESWSVDPLEGPPVAALNFESFTPITTPEQGRQMVARWEAIGPWLEQSTTNLRRGLAEGRVAVETPVRKTIEGIRAILAKPDAELPLLAPAQETHADWPAEELTRFREGLAAAVATSFRPALERQLALLEDAILPAARSDETPGMSRIEGGAAAYQALIRVHTSLDLTAEAIHQVGLDEVARIDGELEELGGRTLGVKGLPAVRDRLRTDRSLTFSTRDEVFAKAESALARANEAVGDWFGILPKAPCVVTRMGEHEEAFSTIAYYRQPAEDGSRPGQYYINTSEPETRPRYEAEVLAYHEAVPGHHLQLAIGQELTQLPSFRRHLGPTAFFEGWGLYTERLSDEMGLYSGDLDRIGILSFDGWRACRLVVDTGMHALGWSRQQAIDFMTDHTALASNNIANEVDRYIVWPGQALAYKIGQLEILRLRAEARERLGERFDIRAFHDAVLGQGALGLEALRSVVERQLA